MKPYEILKGPRPFSKPVTPTKRIKQMLRELEVGDSFFSTLKSTRVRVSDFRPRDREFMVNKTINGFKVTRIS